MSQIPFFLMNFIALCEISMEPLRNYRSYAYQPNLSHCKKMSVPSLCIGLLCTLSFSVQAYPLMGFSNDASDQQKILEINFRSYLSTEDQAVWSKQLSSRPHHPGSEHGRENVKYLAGLFREWGYHVEIEAFDILLPVPKKRSLELIAPVNYKAGLLEDIVPGDNSTLQRDKLLPPYNAYSADGDVTAELVFVNYGLPEDYELLERYGIDVSGKIVIAKYGKSWRGIKPKLAAEKGAIGTLLYSDPADDGYAKGNVYPNGPFKNASGVQRGSVMDMPQYPGDVLTPGKPAIKGIRRLKINKAPTITKIPVLPISYQDAEPLLKALGGDVVPAQWRGALPITYHIGPGPAKVHLLVSFDWQRITIENVIAKWPGAVYPDEWIIRGNHHDAWNHGAQDPISGLVTVLAEAKAIAALAKEGHPPKRTLVYAAWDAEEPGLIGSTEWVEKHREMLIKKAVVYLNTDGNGRGFAGVGGSHTLEPFFDQLLNTIIDPQTGVTVRERLRASIAVEGSAKQREELDSRKTMRIRPLGSGSDFTPFLQHAGIASASLGFGGENAHGSYHTLYDTYEHFTRFVDPGFRYGKALADMAGTATLRLANAEVLPFRFSGLVDNLNLYLKELQELVEQKRKDAQRQNLLLVNNSYVLATDPKNPLKPPKTKVAVPHFNFSPLINALLSLNKVVASLDQVLNQQHLGSSVPVEKLKVLNKQLYLSERALTSDDGLPGRPWYKHQIYAPGFYTGYGVKTLPRIRETIEAELYDQVNNEIAITAEVLTKFSGYLAETRTTVTPSD